MANDSIVIKCACGEFIKTHKWFGHLSIYNDEVEVANFLELHLYLCGNAGYDLGTLPFKLVTERTFDG